MLKKVSKTNLHVAAIAAAPENVMMANAGDSVKCMKQYVLNAV
jgi:hypothetical protein